MDDASVEEKVNQLIQTNAINWDRNNTVIRPIWKELLKLPLDE